MLPFFYSLKRALAPCRLGKWCANLSDPAPAGNQVQVAAMWTAGRNKTNPCAAPRRRNRLLFPGHRAVARGTTDLRARYSTFVLFFRSAFRADTESSRTSCPLLPRTLPEPFRSRTCSWAPDSPPCAIPFFPLPVHLAPPLYRRCPRHPGSQYRGWSSLRS